MHAIDPPATEPAMNLLPKPLRQALLVPHRRRAGHAPQAVAPSVFGRVPVLQAPPLAEELAQDPARQAAERDTARGCGWFESSFELRQGLAVSESTEAGWDEWDTWTALMADRVLLEPSSAQLQ